MTVPRLTERQLQAIKNLMFSAKNIRDVVDFLEFHGKSYLKELSIGEAKQLISELVEGEKTRKQVN